MSGRCYRVSHVEAFRRWEMDDDADTDGLLAQLRGEDSPSERMRVGTAFHRALELANEGLDADELHAHGYVFVMLGDFEAEVADTREVRGSKRYLVDGRPITITGQVDAIDGRKVWDHKTTQGFEAEGYQAGYQWRLYLDIFGADCFVWQVFEVRPDTQDETRIYVSGAHRLEQWRYPDMVADCQRLVERFARFVRERIEDGAGDDASWPGGVGVAA